MPHSHAEYGAKKNSAALSIWTRLLPSTLSARPLPRGKRNMMLRIYDIEKVIGFSQPMNGATGHKAMRK